MCGPLVKILPDQTIAPYGSKLHGIIKWLFNKIRAYVYKNP